MRDSIFMQQGITFDAGGPDELGPAHPVRDRPFPLDLVPRIIPGEEWRSIKRGLAQRIRALNAFVDDVYHAREIVHEGIVPWELIVSRSAFARAAHGIRPPGGVYCHVSGCDLVRDGDGSWKVLEDNVRTPSVISYVLENRVAMTRLVPGLFGSYRVHPVDHYPALLVYPYVPQMIRFYLSEEPILENVRTYLMADPEQRRAALERLDELVVKPVDESGGKGGSSARRPTTRRSPGGRRRSSAAPSAGSRRSSSSSPPARRHHRWASSYPATSTCARSRYSARTSTSSPAGSRASRCARAR